MYLQLSAPALWFYVMAECLKRYLLAQVQPFFCHARHIAAPQTSLQLAHNLLELPWSLAMVLYSS